jgi:hypothetical protein
MDHLLVDSVTNQPVIPFSGDTHLGGEDFDNRVIEHFIKVWNPQHPSSDVSQDAGAMSKLKREVEKAKRVLSSEEFTTLDIDTFHNSRDFSATLTRAKFEELNHDLFEQTLNKVAEMLRDVKVEKDQVNDVVPSVAPLDSQIFGKCWPSIFQARSFAWTSMPMRRWPREPRFKVGFWPELTASVTVACSSKSVDFLLVLKPTAA